MKSGDRELIAILDDEPGVRNGLSRLLRSAGYDTSSYASGGEWLAARHERHEDCLILDIRMPDMDGFEVVDRLNADGWEIPVIILTSFPTEQCRRRAREAGVREFLAKPVERSTLLAALGRALTGKSEL